jgi:hypothetical protein
MSKLIEAFNRGYEARAENAAVVMGLGYMGLAGYEVAADNQAMAGAGVVGWIVFTGISVAVRQIRHAEIAKQD